MRRAQGYFGTSEPGLLDNPRLEGPASLQLRLSLLDDEPNSTFFISLMLSESRGQSQEKECCAQSLALESAALELAVFGCLALPAGTWAVTLGLPMLLVGGGFSLSFLGEICFGDSCFRDAWFSEDDFRSDCSNCCCLAANAAAMVLRR